MTYKEFTKFAKENGENEFLIRTTFSDKKEKAKIRYENGAWYICSNCPRLNGTECEDRLGFAHSWIVMNSTDLNRIEKMTMAQPFISEDDF